MHIIQSELAGILFGSPLRETANWIGPKIENVCFLFRNQIYEIKSIE